MTHDEMIKVIRAHKQGMDLQYKLKDQDDTHWYEASAPSFDFYRCDYRIKPKLAECWIVWCEKTGRALSLHQSEDGAQTWKGAGRVVHLTEKE